MAEKEGMHQRIWQADDFDNRHEMGTRDLPEWCLRQMFPPENLPACDGPPVGAEASGKLADPAGCRPLPHGADEDDDGAQVDLWAEEAYRRWSHSLPATVAIAAEAQSEALWLGKLHSSAPRLAEVVGAVQASAARTGILAGGLGEVLVDCKKERPEPGGVWQIVIHGRVLRSVDLLHGVHPSKTSIQ